MTSLDSLALDDYQELSENDQQLISMVRPPPQAPSGWAWSPLVIALLVTISAVILNSEWMSQKLENIPHYRFSLLGLLFSLTLFYILFLT